MILKQKWWLAFFGAPLLATPLVVLVACGESTSAQAPEAPLTNAKSEFVNNIKAVASSTHDAVSWEVPTLDPSISKVEYFYADTKKTLDEVKALADNQFASALPTQVNYDHAKRFLYVKLTPSTKFKLDNNIIEITATSQVQAIVSKVDAALNFASIDLSKIVVKILSTGYEVNEPADFPAGVKIVYDWGSQKQIDVATLKAALNAQKPLSAAVRDGLSAYLAPLSSSFVVKNDKRQGPQVDEPLYRDRISATDLAKLASIKASATSTSDQVFWEGVQDSYATAEIASFAFLVTDQATATSVASLPGTTWTSTLPTSVFYKHESRHLWAKVNPQIGFYFNESYIDLTASSSVTSIKSKFSAAPWYDALNSFNITATFNASNDEVVILAPEVSAEAAISYRLKIAGVPDALYDSKATLASAILAAINDGKVPTFAAELVLAAPDLAEKYVVTSKTWSFSLQVTNGLLSVNDLPSDVTKLTSLKVASTSVHSSVTWSAAPTWSAQVARVTYLSGDYATLSAVKAAAPAAWVDHLPSTLNYDHAARHLWAKLELQGALVVRNPYLDLTTSSGILSVQSLIDAAPEYASYQQKTVLLSGTEVAPIIDESTAPAFTGVKLIYTFMGISNLTKDEAVQKIIARGALLTTTEVQTLKVTLAPVSSLFVINTPLEHVVATNGGGDSAKAFTITHGATEVDLLPLIANLFVVQKDQVNTSVHWNPYTLPASVASVRFISGNYPDRAAAVTAAASATATLPSAVPYRFGERFLWVIATPAPGYVFKGNETYFNVTPGTKLQVKGVDDVRPAIYAYVKGDPTALPGFPPKLVIKITGKIGSLVADLSALNLPEGVSLVYFNNPLGEVVLSASWLSDKLNRDFTPRSGETPAQALARLSSVEFAMFNLDNYLDYVLIPDKTGLTTADVSGVTL